MQIHSADITYSPGVPGPIRAIHNLLEKHVAVIASELLPRQGTWSLLRHEGCDGTLTVMITSCDDCEPSLIFSRSAAGFHFGVLLDDDYQEMGIHRSFESLVVAASGWLPPACDLSHAS